MKRRWSVIFILLYCGISISLLKNTDIKYYNNVLFWLLILLLPMQLLYDKIIKSFDKSYETKTNREIEKIYRIKRGRYKKLYKYISELYLNNDSLESQIYIRTVKAQYVTDKTTIPLVSVIVAVFTICFNKLNEILQVFNNIILTFFICEEGHQSVNVIGDFEGLLYIAILIILFWFVSVSINLIATKKYVNHVMKDVERDRKTYDTHGISLNKKMIDKYENGDCTVMFSRAPRGSYFLLRFVVYWKKMIGDVLDMKDSYGKKALLILAIIVVVPLLVSLVTSVSLLNVNTDNQWIGFWGAYLGTIFGSIITLIVFKQTIKHSDSIRENDIKDNLCNEIVKQASAYSYYVGKTIALCHQYATDDNEKNLIEMKQESYLAAKTYQEMTLRIHIYIKKYPTLDKIWKSYKDVHDEFNNFISSIEDNATEIFKVEKEDIRNEIQKKSDDIYKRLGNSDLVKRSIISCVNTMPCI